MVGTIATLVIVGVSLLAIAFITQDDSIRELLFFGGGVALLIALVCGCEVFISEESDDASNGVYSTEMESTTRANESRNVVITAEDGSEVFSYEGAIDVEDTGSCIKFDGEEGEHFVIPYRDTDTVEITGDEKCTCGKNCTCAVQK